MIFGNDPFINIFYNFLIFKWETFCIIVGVQGMVVWIGNIYIHSSIDISYINTWVLFKKSKGSGRFLEISMYHLFGHFPKKLAWYQYILQSPL